MKRFTIIALLLASMFAAALAGGTYSQSALVDLSAADTIDVYLSGTSYMPVPASNQSGWSVWLQNGVTMNCSDVDVVVWPMLNDGSVSTNSNNSTTLWTALDLSDSTTVEHKAVGTIDRCFGLRLIVTPTSGSGTMRLSVLYGLD